MVKQEETESEDSIKKRRKHMENMSKLTEASACRRSREFSFVPREGAQPENYFRTIIVKDTIRNALIYNVRDPKEVMQYMQSREPECGYKNYQQMQQQLLWDHRRVMRYLKGESRKPSFPKSLPVPYSLQKHCPPHCTVPAAPSK